MKIQFTIKFFFTLLIISILLFTVGCKKEYAEYPYSDLISFTVKDNVGTALKGAVTNTDITLYWPPFQTVPDSISPVIIISENATVSPASGTKVPFKETTHFTVTAENGTKTVYTLKPTVNQPIPYITSMSPSYSYLFNDVTVFIPGINLSLQGNYFVPDTTLTKVYLSTEGGKTISLPILQATESSIGTGPLSDYITTGTYFTVKVVTGARTVTSGRCVLGEVLPLISSVTVLRAKTYKGGDIVTISGTNISSVNKISVVTVITGVPQDLIIQSTTANSATVQVPATAPSGAYTVFQYTYPANAYHAEKTNVVYTRMVIAQ